MFCKYCGEKLAEGETLCPACGKSNEPSEPAPKKKITVSPLSMACIVVASLSFVFGFVLTTCCLAKNRPSTMMDSVAIIPAFAALGIAIYDLCAHKKDGTAKIFDFISIGLSGFTVLYGFIAYASFAT